MTMQHGGIPMNDMRTRSVLITIVLLGIALVFVPAARAQSVSWTNTVSGGNWSAAGNWRPAPPGFGTNVFLTNTFASSYYTTNDLPALTVANLTMSNASAAVWLINNTNGFTASGNVNLARNAGFDLNGFAATIGGSLTSSVGSVVLVRGASLMVATNVGGLALLGSSAMVITNNGTVQVGATGAGTVTNAGTFTIGSGGSLLSGAVTNTGTIQTYDGAGLIGGFVENRGSIVVTNAGAVLSLTNGAVNRNSILIGLNGTLNIGGTNQSTANASGVIFTNASGATITFGVTLLPAPTQTLNAGTNGIGIVNQGTIQINPTSSHNVTGTVNAVVFNETNGVLATSTYVNQLRLLAVPTNNGAMSINNSTAAIRIDSGDVVNNGTIRSAAGALLLANGSLINNSNVVVTGGGGSIGALSIYNAGTMIFSNTGQSSQNIAISGVITNAGSLLIYRPGTLGSAFNAFTAPGIFNSGNVQSIGVLNGLTNIMTLTQTSTPITNQATGSIIATNGGTFGFTGGVLNQGNLIAYSNSTLGIGAAGSQTSPSRISIGTGQFRNDGTITLLGGAFAASLLTNSATGTVLGNGDFGLVAFSNLISGSVTNFARVLVTRNIVNAGLLAPNGVFNAGAITNLGGGAIVGYGVIESLNTTNLENGALSSGDTGARIQNNAGATILASGGTLILSNGLVNNSNAGTIGATNGILQLGGGALMLTNNGTVLLSGGELRVGDLRNNGSIVLLNGINALTVTGTLTITNTASMLVTNSVASVTGLLTNLGSLRVRNSTITFTNTVVVGGSYQSDPSTNIFLDTLTVTPTGSLLGSTGDRFDFRKDLVVNSTSSTQFNLSASAVSFTGGTNTLAVATSMTIGGQGSMLVSNTTATASGVITNLGVLQVVNSKMTWSNAIVIAGQYVSDPSTNTFIDDATLTLSGTLAGGAGDLFDFKKSLLIHSTNNAGFGLASSTVLFSGGVNGGATVNHTNAITGGDFGTNKFPSANFSYGKLSLGSTNDDVYFTSGGFTNGLAGSNALYVLQLDLFSDTNFVANLHSPFNIYYMSLVNEPFNNYLNDQTYLLDGGGFLMPVVPEPSTAFLFGMGVILVRRIRAKR